MEGPCDVEEQQKTYKRKLDSPLNNVVVSTVKKQKVDKNTKIALNKFIIALFKQKETDMPFNIGYHIKDGIRFLNPYWSAYKAHAKARWLGRKLADVYSSEFIFSAPNYFKAACKMGRIFVNGSPMTDPNYVIQNNDLIYHICHRHEHPILAEPIKIVSETESLLVIDKPPSMPVHACGRYKLHTVVGLLFVDYKRTGLRVLHRLDRTTSGLLLLAKDSKTDLEFKTSLKRGEWRKEYVCKVDGVFPDGEIICDQPIGSLVPTMGIQCVREDGKPSKTSFKKMWSDGKTSVVRCFPETGRTHQIRVHLQYLGYPIVNDYYYNTLDWGPSKGKGGNYGRSFEQLGKDISKAHCQTLWNEPADPSYMSRLERISKENGNLEAYLARIRESNAEYDEICFSCHTKKKIPPMEHFMLHLHCLKYETSSWSYATELPKWAEEPDAEKIKISLRS